MCSLPGTNKELLPKEPLFFILNSCIRVFHLFATHPGKAPVFTLAMISQKQRDEAIAAFSKMMAATDEAAEALQTKLASLESLLQQKTEELRKLREQQNPFPSHVSAKSTTSTGVSTQFLTELSKSLSTCGESQTTASCSSLPQGPTPQCMPNLDVQGLSPGAHRVALQRFVEA